MTHKEQILNTLEKEINVCKRLFTLLTKELYEYKPAEGMRTTVELLRYISWCSGSCLESYFETDPEKLNTVYERNWERGETMKPEEFPARMDEEYEKIRSYFELFEDADLLSKTVTIPWREKMPLGQAILETSLKWLTGYKMQLFLYMRSNGLEIDTGDCWINTKID